MKRWDELNQFFYETGTNEVALCIHIFSIFGNLSKTIKIYGPCSSAWVGEAGEAYNSGGNHVSNRFLNSFWYLDQLGIASCYSTKVYCRQTLIGGNYGLLNTTTFAPNPDYYK
ncbi:Heparanase-like protein 2 [Glycine max]|nr:Heparanase-like protein 2 [Glycine max]